MNDDIAAALRRLIDDERAALRSGRFADLAGIALRKTAILPRLAGATRDEMQRLRDLASDLARNQRLIEAALNGVRAARARARAVRAAAQGTKSYAPDGAMRQIAAPATSVERRA